METTKNQIAILGLGQTLKYFRGEMLSIGCNDIWRHHKTDYVVTMDHKREFLQDRLEVMEQCKPEKFYYYDRCPDWKNNHNAEAIHSLPWNSERRFKESQLYHSTNTPFVACSIAFNLGFKHLILYGVDLMNHKKLNHPTNHGVLEKTLKDFRGLNETLLDYGVVMHVAHRYSELSKFLPVWK